MRFWETRRAPVGSVPPHPLKTTVVPTAAVWNHDSNCSRRYVLIRGRTSYARAEERLRESSITTLQRFPWPGKLSIVFTHGRARLAGEKKWDVVDGSRDDVTPLSVSCDINIHAARACRLRERNAATMQRFVVVLIVMSAAALPVAAQNSGDLDKGRQLFLGMCSRCHGAEGGGGEGPNLNRPALSRAPDDQALTAVIRDGIPDRGMPRIRRFTDAEMHAMVLYVRSLGRTVALAVPGSPEKGKAVYQKSGCSSCHIINGEGGTLGSELSSVGARRAPDYLRQAIVDPAAALPRGALPIPGRSLNEFLPVRVVTRDGREVRGIRVNEDSFTIQVKDAGNQLYSFRKADLKTLDKELGKSVMPDYKARISGADLDDLVAYLHSMGGAN